MSLRATRRLAHLTAALCLSVLVPATVALAGHPLDPLTKKEINAAREAIEDESGLPDFSFFPAIRRLEPSKADVLDYEAMGGTVSRKALVLGYVFPDNELYEIVVDLDAKEVESSTLKSGSQPPVDFSEYDDADAILREDEDVQEAIEDRDLEMDDVYWDIWAGGELVGFLEDEDLLPMGSEGHRVLAGLPFLAGPNPYDRPISDLVVALDMNTREVIHVFDEGEAPINDESGNAEEQRPALGQLSQSGASFKIAGNRVKWDRWRFRFGMDQAEGLVLHLVEYLDTDDPSGATYRSIAYRISLAEIWVPYARDTVTWFWRAAFDLREYYLGAYAISLVKGVTVPKNAVLVDAFFGDGTLTPVRYPRVVGIWEEFVPHLWSRTDPDTGETDARGGRILAISWACAIGNYNYVFTYYFHQDGSIKVEAGASGTLLLQGVNSTEEADEFGSLVAPDVGAPSHMHFINYRLDLDVDGQANQLFEINTMADPDAFGNGFVDEEELVDEEDFLDGNPDSDRFWLVKSTDRLNRLDLPTGYSVESGDYSRVYADDAFPPLAIAQFAKHEGWVTCFHDGELSAAGDYPFQGEPGLGLPEYIDDPESVNEEDLVFWRTISLLHHPEPEEYPVMPRRSRCFFLRPSGFFDRNPALDLPK